MTPLAEHIARDIALDGPISVERFMGLCLSHPTLGYYTTRDPLGRGGDFTTAPEISQMFGELIGVWAASTWQAMGAPGRVHLVELGPGRGTLMADAYRAARALPAFCAALDVHLVEISPVLRERQRVALSASGASVFWHETIASLPENAPLIIIANEFFDALPIRQVVRRDGEWHERMVGLDDKGALAFGLGPLAAPVPFTGGEGDIREMSPASLSIMATLAERCCRQGGALLAVDYGYARSQAGDSLQALKDHAFADVLASAGTADLTAHVDFAALAAAGRSAGAVVHPLLTQRCLLARLGIGARAQALVANASDGGAAISAAFDRLTGTGQGAMGTLFKALALSSPGFTPPAFDSPDPLITQITA